MAAGVEEWGADARRASNFGISQNPAYGLDLRQSRVQLNKQAGAVGAQAVILTKKTASAFRNRPYQSAVVFLCVMNILLLFAGTTQLAWYYQEINVGSRVMRTTVTWDRLQICDSSPINRRTTNSSREVCAVVFLGDIRLDQDYVRVAGWSAFSCNLVALFFLMIAAYSSYLARVNRTDDVLSLCRVCLAYRYSPLGMHAATSLLVLSSFASFSSIMLTNLPNDPTLLNPKFAEAAGEVGRFGSAYGITVTVFIFELACIALSGLCAAEADRNPDDYGDSATEGAGYPPARGSDAAQEFDDVYAMGSADAAESRELESTRPAVSGNGDDSGVVSVPVSILGSSDRATRTAAMVAAGGAGGTPSGHTDRQLTASHPDAHHSARQASVSGPSVRPSAQFDPSRPAEHSGPRLSLAPAVPPRRSMGGPSVRPSVAAADAATLEAVSAAVDAVEAEEEAQSTRQRSSEVEPQHDVAGAHMVVDTAVTASSPTPGNPFADSLD